MCYDVMNKIGEKRLIRISILLRENGNEMLLAKMTGQHGNLFKDINISALTRKN
jgi:hypothetical protein